MGHKTWASKLAHTIKKWSLPCPSACQDSYRLVDISLLEVSMSKGPCSACLRANAQLQSDGISFEKVWVRTAE